MVWLYMFFFGGGEIGVTNMTTHENTQSCDSNAGLCQCQKVLSCLFCRLRSV